ncbi:MAG: trypsin-like serine protease [Firmicutes bacterium]|nr:trypsin-like serine protease [Bacillota bacterium]
MHLELNKKTLLTMLIAIMIISGLFGFGGAYLANFVFSKNEAALIECYTETGEPISFVSETGVSLGMLYDNCTDLSVPEVYSRNADSVVEIRTETVQSAGRMGQYVFSGAGSGVIITADGYVVTNNHVINGAQTIIVRLNSGENYQASLIGRDFRTDIAVLKIDASGLKPVVFGDSGKLIIGEQAIVIGNPLGELGGTVTEGIISALDRDIVVDGESMSLLQTSAAVNPGNSGGGLFNDRGELVGIVNAKSGGFGVEGLGFAIPVNTAAGVIEQIINFGYVPGRPILGVRLIDITDPGTALYYRVQNTGVYVYESMALNELQTADRIISINGKEVSNTIELRKIIDLYDVGDTVTVKVQRGISELELQIILIEENY